jgi:hypothetical protein
LLIFYQEGFVMARDSNKTSKDVRYPFCCRISWGRRNRKKRGEFNPNSDYVAQSVTDYLGNGGSITRIERRKDDEREEMVTSEHDHHNADTFLLDQ